MNGHENNILHYMPISENDENWGVVCTTVGMQDVPPNGRYPVGSHPDSYNFKSQGRVLHEYQLVYIVRGEGVFKSASCRETKVQAGTMIMLFPDEWHYYSPTKEIGWKEWWVGFRGPNIDKRVQAGFFSPSEPLIKIGYSEGLESCYSEIIRSAREEASGFQMLISGIVLHILGSVLFKKAALQYASDPAIEKVNAARDIMRGSIGKNVSPEDIAVQLGVGYSWFRHKFKEYVGSSPAQYQLQLKFNKAKELLTTSNLSIKDVAYALGFEDLSQFSLFFKNRSGFSPRLYKQREVFK